MEFIALDIGTSFTKGAVVDVESLRIRDVRRTPSPSRMDSGDPLLHELDADNVVAGARQLIDRLANTSSDCAGILMTGQMGGLVLCNDDGTARRPYISWLDRRATSDHPDQSGSIFEALQSRVDSRAASVFGNEFRPGLPLSFLYSLLVCGELSRHSGAIPVTLPDYVAASLCGERPVMEWTGATGTLDIATRSFPKGLLAEIGLGSLSLPELVSYQHRIGTYQAGGQSLAVYAATGDHQCSLVGTLLAEGELSINISTGSQVSMLTDESEPGQFQIRPYFDGLWLKTITNIPAGRALTSIISLLAEFSGDAVDLKSAYQWFFERAESVSESDVEVNLAFFPGAVDGPGFIQNLNEGNLTVGHLSRSCLQQMADYYRQMAQRVDPTGSSTRIAFSGGIAQMSEFLRNLISQALGTPCRLAASSEDSLMGMMILGRVIGGLDSSVREATQAVRNQLQ